MKTTVPALVAYINPDQWRKDLAVDLADITGGMQQQASYYAYYATQTVKAKRQYERQKSHLEVLEAKLDKHYRKTLVNEETDGKGKTTTKKATEPQIRAAIVEDARWIALNSRMLDAQEIYRLAEVAERSFEHRKDMLLQIARDASKEREGQLRVVSNQSNRERLLEQMKQVPTSGTPD